jgi:hypothetical protein
MKEDFEDKFTPLQEMIMHIFEKYTWTYLFRFIINSLKKFTFSNFIKLFIFIIIFLKKFIINFFKRIILNL